MKHNPSPQGAHFYKETGLKLKKRARLEGMQPETGRKGHFNQPSNEQLGCVYTELQEPRIYNHSVPGRSPRPPFAVEETNPENRRPK